MARRRSGYVQIDVCEILCEVDDDDLLDACHSRKLTPAAPDETVDLDIVREAYEALQRGYVIEARSILDRLLFPKWKAPKDCETEYRKLF